MAINGGTSCTSEILSKRLPSRKKVNYFIEISPTGDYFPEVSIHSGASALMNWFKSNFAFQEIEIAQKKKRDVWEVIYNEARQIPTGNLGLIMVPYLGGAGAPYWDLDARGVLFGMMLDHKRPHLVRAIMEGLAYETRRAMELMVEGTGAEIKEVRMYGGSSKSDIWNQIFADVLGLNVYTTKTTETTALGVAICAAVGSRVYDTMEQAVEKMVHIDRKYCPIDKNWKLYDKLYNQVYKHFYDKVYELVHKSARISRSE
jgi:xylulokinase